VNTSTALGALAVAVIGYLFVQSVDLMEIRFARRVAKPRMYPQDKNGFFHFFQGKRWWTELKKDLHMSL